jgi:hypothetical protein
MMSTSHHNSALESSQAVHCVKCSYDITSLPIIAICPECTTPCRTSHQAHLRKLAFQTYGRFHQIGWRLFLLGFITFLTIPAILFTFLLGQTLLGANSMASLFAWIAASFAISIGSVLMTSFAKLASGERPSPVRLVARITAIIAMTLQSVVLLFSILLEDDHEGPGSNAESIMFWSWLISTLLSASLAILWHSEFKRLIKTSSILSY